MFRLYLELSCVERVTLHVGGQRFEAIIYPRLCASVVDDGHWHASWPSLS